MRVRLAAALAALVVLVVPQAASAWTWPVDGPVLRPFSFGSDPYAAGQHRGVDIGGASGAPVAAPAAGTVSFAGTVPSGGKSVTIQTQDGYSVTLVHLGSIGTMRGTAVEEGATVGSVGSSGDVEVDVPYVHLGVRVTADPQGYVDPLGLLPPRPVLTPPALAPPVAVLPSAPSVAPAPAAGEAAAGPPA